MLDLDKEDKKELEELEKEINSLISDKELEININLLNELKDNLNKLKEKIQNENKNKVRIHLDGRK